MSKPEPMEAPKPSKRPFIGVPDMHFKGIPVGKVLETQDDLVAHSYPHEAEKPEVVNSPKVLAAEGKKEPEAAAPAPAPEPEPVVAPEPAAAEQPEEAKKDSDLVIETNSEVTQAHSDAAEAETPEDSSDSEESTETDDSQFSSENETSAEVPQAKKKSSKKKKSS